MKLVPGEGEVVADRCACSTTQQTTCCPGNMSYIAPCEHLIHRVPCIFGMGMTIIRTPSLKCFYDTNIIISGPCYILILHNLTQPFSLLVKNMGTLSHCLLMKYR